MTRAVYRVSDDERWPSTSDVADIFVSRIRLMHLLCNLKAIKYWEATYTRSSNTYTIRIDKEAI